MIQAPIQNCPIGESGPSPPRECRNLFCRASTSGGEISPRLGGGGGRSRSQCPWSLIVVVGSGHEVSHPITALDFTPPDTSLHADRVIILFLQHLDLGLSQKHGHADLQDFLQSAIMTVDSAVNGLSSNRPPVNGNTSHPVRAVNVLKFGGQSLVLAQQHLLTFSRYECWQIPRGYCRCRQDLRTPDGCCHRLLGGMTQFPSIAEQKLTIISRDPAVPKLQAPPIDC